jgi:hypothetical protein
MSSKGRRANPLSVQLPLIEDRLVRDHIRGTGLSVNAWLRRLIRDAIAIEPLIELVIERLRRFLPNKARTAFSRISSKKAWESAPSIQRKDGGVIVVISTRALVPHWAQFV